MNKNPITLNTQERPSQQKRVHKVNMLKGIALSLVVLGFLGFTISNVSANELNQASISYGGKTNQLDDDTRNLVIAQNGHSKVYDQLIGKAKTKTRAQVIAEKQSTPATKAKTFNGIEKSFAPFNTRVYTPEFTVYDATSFLEDDIDGDGYYQTFGVVFDVDVYNPNGNENSVIYAELYISSDGVNWEHYYTTDDFLIQGSNDQDQFEVITTFAEGYRTNHYDILIDIYEVGFADIVATYSSDDNNSLYALPLESAEYDRVYVEEVVVHAGSSSIPFVLFIVLMALVRIVRVRSKTA
ncbi:choice-of-anchor H family protein [Colwellia sp. RE-S-Sl-9]